MTPVCTPSTGNNAAPSAAVPSAGPRVQIAAAACACGAATAFLFAVDPNHHAVYPQCLLYNATGIYCAGCGATRALYALLHGRVFEALHDNAFFIALLPFLLYAVVSYTAKAWIANAWPQIFFNERTLLPRAIVLFVLMIAFAILRNLPGYEWLRPMR